ncbi:hypothetical protein, conserved [Eimeria acervulina]|uniref:Regulator of chromosome condensation domain-containing protein n=1 Tax=Eimeria acervulina TaxID=5801 RepID=U6GPX1_EIMAC|nr:hypothetical protein, conserved [Eimeria acervulina]CDI81323.1 hypothetical protein, conserved [Eimeria acervulina]
MTRGGAERSTVWRSLIDWGHRDRVGPLLEVLLPGHSGAVNLALGGTEMVALSEGKLFGTPIGVPSHEQSDLASLTLREITPEPVEVSGVSMKDFTRHCRQSEDLGISQALRVEAPCLTTLVETDKHPIFVKVAAGKQHFAALTSHGILYTWGKGGLWGAGSPLGHGDSKHRCRPTPVGQFIHAGEFVVDVACGTASTCVVTSSGRVFSSGAADYGVNGSGMLISSQVFKELEFFQGILSPGLVEVKRRIEELQLQQLERLRKNFEEKGIERSHIVARPFEAPQDAPEDMNCGSATESVLSPSVSVGGGLRFPKVMSGTCHCGVLTPEGALWLWGRNDRLQLSREKSVMASGGESHYPLLAEFFTRAGLPLESCSLGPCHSLALARNGAVYEWGGQNAESPHTVDLHWEYPESIFKRPVRKVVAGGFSSTTAFSAALTETGEAFLWGPGVLKMPLGLKATEGQVPELIRPPMPTRESMSQQNNVDWRVLDIFAGQQGCLLVTTNSA